MIKNTVCFSIFVLFCTISLVSIVNAHAFSGTISDQTSCESIPGVWSTSPDTCTITTDKTISNGETWTVNSESILAIDDGVILTLENGGTINNFGAITIINYGLITSQCGAVYTGNAPIGEPGLWQNECQDLVISDELSCEVSPILGTWDGTDTCTITIATIASGSSLTINPGTTLIISNDLLILSGGTLTNNGDIFNNGNISNNGNINNNFGGTISNQCGAVYTGAAPNGAPVQNLCDTDGDGIVNSIDTQPNIFSDNFSDNDGITIGEIVTRGDPSLKLLISDEPNPLGVRISTDLSGGGTPAQIDTCGGTVHFTIPAGKELIKTGCQPDPITVIVGPVDIALTGTDGSTATTSIEASNTLSFDPSTFTFSAPSTNANTIIINTGGNNISLVPGMIIQEITVSIDVKPGDTTNPINLKKDTTVPVGLFGSSTFDVSMVDLKSMRFGGHTIQVPTHSSIEKIDKDKYKDIILQFKVFNLGFTASDTQGCLTGKTTGGTPFRGCDAVLVLTK